MLRTEVIRPLAELLAAHARERGDAIAFRDERRSVTWAELDKRTARLGGHLHERLEHGGPVAICMGNAVEAVESYLAVARAGAVGAFLNPSASTSELAYMLDDSGAELLLVDAERREQISAGVDVVATDGAFEELARSAGPTPPDDLDLDAPAWMLYTSGTTGRPKGVLLSQRSCLWVVAACWAPVLDLRPDEELLSALPLFHSYALDLTVVAVVATGARLRLLPRFSSARAISTLREEPVSLFAGVPTMFHYLVQELDGEPLRAERLRLCVSAGAILPGSLTEAFEQVAGVPLLDGYGITETSTMVTMNWPTGDRPPGSCGLPLPGCAVRLVDAGTGADVEPEEEGELIVRGPQVMLGYHNRPDDTAEALRDGWYHTGDLARADRNGYLTITGRIKELIIRGGENIAPAEVEQAIVEHPAVTDAAVVGRPDEALGEVVAAFVVAAEGTPEADELRTFAADRLAEFKVPAEFHFVDEIPRTGSGKVMRHRLVELLA